jgi:hypothetical protein
MSTPTASPCSQLLRNCLLALAVIPALGTTPGVALNPHPVAAATPGPVVTVDPGPPSGTASGAATRASSSPGSGEAPDPQVPAITTSGDEILRGGQPWWFLGYNSFTWSGDCGNPEELMTTQQVEDWFASMRHDGHGAVRLMFFDGWNLDRLDAALAAAKQHKAQPSTRARWHRSAAPLVWGR